METYDYRKNIVEDIKNVLSDYDISGMTKDEASEYLNDELWTRDKVTGNASGSYFYNAWDAEEAICHNLDLLSDACKTFCCDDVNIAEKGAEWCDVTIRCYLLSECIEEVLDEIYKD